MRSLRFLGIVFVLVAGLAGAAYAQRITAPGTYAVNVAVAPSLLPPGSLPAGFPDVGPLVVPGTLTVTQNRDGTFSVQFQDTTDSAHVNAVADFSSQWTGFQLGTLVVGGQIVTNAIISIDAAHLLRGHITGFGPVNGETRHLLVRIGAGGVITSWKVTGKDGASSSSIGGHGNGNGDGNGHANNGKANANSRAIFGRH